MASSPSIARTLVVAAAMGWAAPAPLVLAQAARPSRGLFGGVTKNAADRQTLDVSASIAEAYDENLVADSTPTAAAGALQQSGFYSSFIPQVNFARQGTRLQLALNAGSNVRYYDHGHQFIALSHSVGGGFSAQLSQRDALSLNQSVSYAPVSLSGLFAPSGTPALGHIDGPTADSHVSSDRSYGYSTTAGFTHNASSRTTMSVLSAYRYSDFVGESVGFTDLRSYEVGGRVNHSFDRRAGLRIGYTYRKAQYSLLQHPIEHALDFGMDFSRPLSQTRKVAFGFTLGPTMIDGPLEGIVTNPSGRHYRVVGEAFVARDVGRSWNGRASYRRGVGFVQGLSQPVFSDAVTVQTAGLLSRRTDLDISASLSTGGSAFAGASAPFSSYNANSRLRFAVSKGLAAYVEYLFYFYDFSQGVQLPPGVPSRLTRNGARIGLTLWVPVRHR